MITLTRKIVLLGLLALFANSLSHAENAPTAETRYIVDRLIVSLRESPDENSAVVASNLSSGTQLSIIEEDKTSGYTQVSTASGQRGWLKSRYLQKTPTASLRVAQLEKQLADLSGKDKGAMLKDLQLTQADLEAAKAQVARLEKELMEVKHASTNAVKLSAQNKELIEKNQILQSKIDSLSAVTDQKQDDQSTTLFIYGGLLVLATLIANVIIDGIKRKRSYGGGW